MRRLRDRLEAGLKAATPDVIIFGAEQARLPNTTLFTHPGLRAETAVIAFDLEGVAVSSGSACSSGKVQPSHVLAAMGVEPALARGRDPRFQRPCHHRGRYRSLSECLDKAFGITT